MRVGVLVYPGCFASEVFGVPDLLRIGSRVADRSDVIVTVVSPRRRVEVAGRVDLRVSPLYDCDLLVVPGFDATPGVDIDGVLESLKPELAAIRRYSAVATPIVSICVGAFLLAEAGLLDGRVATTSWLYCEALATRYPQVDVQPDRLVVADGGVTTTAAFAAMYDFAIGFLRENYGDVVARAAARITLVDDARESQAAYVDMDLLPAPGRGLAAEVMRYLRRRMDQPYSLAGMAAEFHLSKRTLLRRFAAETGKSPLSYLQEARVARARHLLTTTDQKISLIAKQTGYADAGSFAELFRGHSGCSPSEYRASFGRRPSHEQPDGQLARRRPPTTGSG